MKVNNLENSILITLEKKDSPNTLNNEISKNSYKLNNLIIDFNNIIIHDYLSLLKSFCKSHKSIKKSIVIVTDHIDYNKLDLNLVPTLQEALDYISLEEIERDLNLL